VPKVEIQVLHDTKFGLELKRVVIIVAADIFVVTTFKQCVMFFRDPSAIVLTTGIKELVTMAQIMDHADNGVMCKLLAAVLFVMVQLRGAA
jgi:hypothetical protein